MRKLFVVKLNLNKHGKMCISNENKAIFMCTKLVSGNFECEFKVS